MDNHALLESLRALGEELKTLGVGSPVEIVIAGGSAGLLGGMLRGARTTSDCDVIWLGDNSAWRVLEIAAREVARRMGLSSTWLNRDCSMFAWCLPLAWHSRAELEGRFGQLIVRRLARIDLIASKVVAAPKRPQDVEDLRDMRPTMAEIESLEEHLDRLEAEHLDGMRFEKQRALLHVLRGGL